MVMRVDMARLRDTIKHCSMTNDITDYEGLLEIMPNLDAKFSILPNKFTDYGPNDDKVHIFSCMVLSIDNKYEKDIPTDFFAGRLAEEDVVQFLNLFKIESDTMDPIEAIYMYLHNYPYLYTRDE
jgi:hypothetical protein